MQTKFKMDKEKKTKQTLEDRTKRLRNLHKLRQEARTQNYHEVLAEDLRDKLPKNWESRKRQAEWLLADEKARGDAKRQGKDYDRHKLLEISAVDATRVDRKKNKPHQEEGFKSFEAQTQRQYQRLVKGMAPRNMEKYELQKEQLGEDAFYGNPNAILHGRINDSPSAIKNMVKDLELQIERKKKFSRRRIYNDDADVDFINERNAKFNKKLDRYYGEYTAEIKQNLERGTAI